MELRMMIVGRQSYHARTVCCVPRIRVSGTSIVGVSGDGIGEQNACPTWPTLPSLLGVMNVDQRDRADIIFN